MEKDPFEALKFDSSPYRTAKNESLSKSNNLFDSTISQTMNKSSQVAAVQGRGNPGRLSADTFAKVAEDRDRRNSQIETEFNMQEVNALTSFNNQKQMASAQWKAQQGSVFDTIFGLAVPAITGGIGAYQALNFGANLTNNAERGWR